MPREFVAYFLGLLVVNALAGVRLNYLRIARSEFMPKQSRLPIDSVCFNLRGGFGKNTLLMEIVCLVGLVGCALHQGSKTLWNNIIVRPAAKRETSLSGRAFVLEDT
jgi:hypothetical protein